MAIIKNQLHFVFWLQHLPIDMHLLISLNLGENGDTANFIDLIFDNGSYNVIRCADSLLLIWRHMHALIKWVYSQFLTCISLLHAKHTRITSRRWLIALRPLSIFFPNLFTWVLIADILLSIRLLTPFLKALNLWLVLTEVVTCFWIFHYIRAISIIIAVSFFTVLLFLYHLIWNFHGNAKSSFITYTLISTNLLRWTALK